MTTLDWIKDDDYAWTNGLTRREWACEFLRRNPDFRIAWRDARLAYGIAGYDEQTTMLVSLEQTPSLAQWGCLYCSASEHDAREAIVFWSPDLCPSVLRFNAFELAAKTEALPFFLRDIVSPSVLLEMPTGPQYLLFTEGGRSLQLVIEGADVTKLVRVMADGAPDRVLAGPQLRALRCFNDLRLSGRLYSSHLQREPLSAHWRVVLRVLDGDLAGASQRDIACHVFAGDYTDQLWSSRDRPLRDRVRRALRRGYALMHRGYRSLLS